MKVYIGVIIRSILIAFFALLINSFAQFGENFICFAEKNSNLEKFIKEQLFTILSILVPITFASFTTFQIYILQRKEALMKKQMTKEEEKFFSALTYISNAHLRIVKYFFWAMMAFLFTQLFSFELVVFQYLLMWIQLSIFISFFIGLYHMVIITSDIFNT